MLKSPIAQGIAIGAGIGGAFNACVWVFLKYGIAAGMACTFGGLIAWLIAAELLYRQEIKRKRAA